MFAKACEKALRYTHPLIQNTKTVDDELSSTTGTYFFINKQGWAVSAAHVFNPMVKFGYDQKHIKEINEILARDKAEGRESSAKMDPKWLTHHSFWFGADQIRLSQLHIFANTDLAIFKLENVPEAFLRETAVLGDVSRLVPGTSLCKIGFPIGPAKPGFKDGNFTLSIPSMPALPYEGIFTRMINDFIDKEKKISTKYLETSTPGIPGQSGGPTVDVNGVVYAVQSRTISLPLGTSPKYVEGDKVISTPQYINLGNGIPVDVLIKALLDKKIPFDTVNQDSDGSTYVIN